MTLSGLRLSKGPIGLSSVQGFYQLSRNPYHTILGRVGILGSLSATSGSVKQSEGLTKLFKTLKGPYQNIRFSKELRSIDRAFRWLYQAITRL